MTVYFMPKFSCYVAYNRAFEISALLFTARRYAERGYEIACCLSVRPSVTLRCFSQSLEYFENNFMAK